MKKHHQPPPTVTMSPFDPEGFLKDTRQSWPPDAFRRAEAWLRADHEPNPREVMELFRELYQPLMLLPEIHKLLTHLNQEMKEMASKFKSIDEAVTGLTADVAAEKNAEESIATFVRGVPALIAQAIADAKADGATDAQLQSFSDLSDSIQAQTANIVDAATTEPAAPAPAPTPDPGSSAPTGGTPPA